MIIITTEKKFNKCKDCGFYLFKITNNLHVCRMYGNKKLHPIGYHIPILVYLKN